MKPIAGLFHPVRLRAAKAACALLFAGFALSPAAAQDLTLQFGAPTDYTPGATSQWVIEVSNAASAANEPGLTVATAFPADGEVTAATCVYGDATPCDSTIVNGELTTQSIALDANQSITITLTVSHPASAGADPLVASATLDSSNDSQDTSLNASASRARDATVSLAKTSPLAEYVPGGTGSYEIIVSHDGGVSDALGLTLVDSAPTGMTIESWTCTAAAGASCPNASGTGNISETFDLPVGGSLDYDLAVSYAETATADPLVNTASLSDPDGPNPSDSASLPRANADLRVAFDAGSPSAYVPGTTGNAIALTVTNDGPSDVANAPVSLAFPAEVVVASWQCGSAACAPGSGTGDVSTAVTLAAGASVGLTLQLDYDSSALTGTLNLDAVVGAGNKPDDNLGNNEDRLALAIDRRADIEVTKTDGLMLVSPGDSFVYSIAVTNNGPSDVGQGATDLGILLNDTFPADLLGDPGVCTGDPAAPCAFVCPSDGGVAGSYDPDSCPSEVEVVELTGNIQNQSLRLAAGSTTTIFAYVRVSGTAADGSEISNTATVSIADTDPVTELNPGAGGSSTDTTQVEISTDVVVTKTDNATAAVAGETHTYTVVVENAGNQAADGVAVFDEMPLYSAGTPAGFVPGSIQWQCRAFNNACCISGSSQCGTSSPTAPVTADILDQGVDLPGQSRVEFTITGRIDPRATGTLSNTASATLPPAVTESDPSDNAATDDDTQLTVDAALSINKVLNDIQPVGIDIDPNAEGPPWQLTYRIEVANAGPSMARAVNISDDLLDPLLERATAIWNCEILADPDGFTTCQSGTGPLAATIDLGVDARVAFELDVETTDQAIGTITNSASADAASVTIESSLVGEADLQIMTAGLSQATPGEDYNYTITVTNLGDDPVFGATVTDEFPPELINVAWTCDATTPVPGDLEHFGLAGPAEGAGERLAISADGRHVYQVQPGVDAVLVYLRNNVPGLGFGSVAALETERNNENDGGDPGTTVENMDNPIDVVLSPDGRHLYVLSDAPADSTADNAIVVFSRSTEPGKQGQLSFAAAVTEGVPGDPRRLAVTNDNVYVSGDAGAVAVYARNVATGVPSLVETQTAGVPAAPGAMAIDPGDGWLIVASSSIAEVAWFEINDDDSMGTPIGALSLLTTTTDADLAGAEDLAVVPQADDLYVAAGGSGNLAAWRYLDSNGDGVPEPSETQNIALAGLTGVDVAPDGEHVLAVAPGANRLTRLRRDIVSGELRERSDRTGDPGLAGPQDLVVAPDGRHVLVAASAGGAGNRPLVIYTRRAPDPLFAFIENDRDGEGSITGLNSPADVAISPDGRNVYVVNLNSGSLVEFDRDPDATEGGAHLTHRATQFNGVGAITGMSAPEYVLVSPGNDKVIVSSEDSDSIAVFDRDSDGTLTFRQAFFDGVDGVDGLGGARGLAMDSTGTHLYVAGGFERAIAVFQRLPDDSFGYIGRIDNSAGGVSGLDGVRDLVVSADDSQVFAVSQIDDSLVVFDRETSLVDPDYGLLTFRQKASAGDQPMAVSVSPDGDHVYVAAQITDSISVFRRETDPASSAFGSVVFAQQIQNLSGGVEFMDGPRDVEVSPDGKRVYVATEFDSSVLVFDRDQNAGSDNYGGLSLLEVRRDEVDGVQGLDNGYALAVSSNSRNVYFAGFDDRAVASFVLGIGSVCTGGGSGAINDSVTIGNGGFLVYRVSANVRPDAAGSMTNTASVATPERVDDPNTANNSSTLVTDLVPRADLQLTKTNSQVSVVAGETVTYEIRVTNLGPSNLASSAGLPVTVSDLLGDNPDFESDSITWSCAASGSGALDFVEAVIDAPAVEGDPDPDLGLAGVADVAVLPDPDDAGPLPPMLVAVSVIDDAVVLFERDPVDGALTHRLRVRDGEMLAGDPVSDLAGASAVAAGPDGRFVYVASRVDDALNVFAVVDDGSGEPTLELAQTLTGVVGLNQAVDVTLGTDGRFVYVAGANDDAVAVFERDADPLSAGYGLLTWLESERNGFDDDGVVVTGLDGPEALVASPDGAHLYAVSSTAGAIVRFDIESDGRLLFAESRTASSLDVDLAGAAAATIGPLGRHLYVASSAADRILVLARNADALSGSYGQLAKVEEVVQGVSGVTGLLSPRGLTVSSDGLHLYAAGQVSDAVTWFLRDPVAGTLNFGGVLSNRSSFVDGLDGVSALALDESDARLYGAGTLQAAVTRFERSSDSICPVSGLGQLEAIPVDIAAGGSVTFEVGAVVAASASGQLINEAFVETPPGTDENADNDSMADTDVVEVEADLRISKDDGRAEFDGLDGALALVGTDDSLYVAGADDNGLGIFSRLDAPGTSGHGRLTFVDALRNGADGVSGLTDVASLAIAPDEAQVYAVSPTDNTVVVFTRDPSSGRLAFVESEASGVLGVTGLGGASDVAVSPDGEHVYVTGRLDNTVAVFDRRADAMAADYGELAFLGQQQNGTDGVTGLTEPRALTVAPDGRHVYAVSGVDDSVVVFQRNINTGSASFGRLTFEAAYSDGGGVAGLAGAIDVAVSPDGQFVQVLGAAGGTLALFERNATSGALTFVEFKADGTGATTGLSGANRLRFSPDGAHLYVAGRAADAIVRFDVGSDGRLDFAGRVAEGDPAPATGGDVIGLDGVADVWISPDGDHLYSAASISDAVATFARANDPDPVANTGALDYLAVLIDGLGGVAPGDVVTYRIIVENLGPSDVVSARVVDDFPDTFSAVTWSCTASASPPASCAPGGTGSIDDGSVSLAVGARVTYLADAVVRDDATGRIVNTATVTGIGVQDPVIANNSATDDDTVLSPRIDLVVDVDNGLAEAVPGESLTYDIEIRNIGPSLARDVTVTDEVPPALFDVAWACTATPVEGLLGEVAQPVGPATALDSVGALTVAGSGRFAYAAGDLGGTAAIAVFQRDSVSGALGTVLATYRDGEDGFEGLGGASDWALSGDGRFLFLAAESDDAVSVFERNAESGLLTPAGVVRDGLGGIDGLGGVRDLLFDPQLNVLYAAGTLDDAIVAFSLDPTTGALTFIDRIGQSDPGVDGLNGVVAMALYEGHVLAVASDNESLAAFERNPSNGTLTPAALVQNFEFGPPDPAPVLDRPSAIRIAGELVVVAAEAGNSISAFHFDPVAPAFERAWTVQNGVGTIAGLEGPVALAWAERQQRLYVASAASERIHLFSLRDAVPERVAEYGTADLPALSGLSGLALPALGGPLYTLADPGAIGVFSRQRGSLCPLSGRDELRSHAVEIVPGGTLTYALTGTVFANATGTLAYTVEAGSRFAERELNPADNRDDDIDALVPAPDLSTSKTDGLTEVVAGTSIAWDIDFANAGVSDAIAARLLDAVPTWPADPGVVAGSATWSCSTDPPLVGGPGLADPALVGATSLRIAADGRRLLAADPDNDRVLILNRDAAGGLAIDSIITDGMSLGGTTVQGLDGASSAVETADGRFLYVAGRDANSVVAFERTETGLFWLQQVQSGTNLVAGLIGAEFVVLSPDERFVFAASPVSDSIVVLERGDDGRLSFVERVRDGFGTIEPDSEVIRGVRGLHVSSDGERLYAVAPGSSSVASFAVDPDRGSLTYIGVLRDGEGGVSGLAEPGQLVAAPGDAQIYVTDRSGGALTVLSPDGDGVLEFDGAITGLAEPVAAAMDPAGQRLYVLEAGGTVALFARDWASGSLEARDARLPAGSVPSAATGLIHAPAPDGLLISAPTGDALVAFDERPLSRCLTASGADEAIDIGIDLGAGGSGALALAATVHPAARGDLINSATLVPGSGADPVPGNDVGIDATTVIAVSDLAVTKTGPADAVAGEPIVYEIIVTNAGPSDALGIVVSDAPPLPVSGIEWTCAPSAGSSCPASGTGAPDFPATVRVGGQLTVTLTGDIDPAFIGAMTNAVTLTPEPGAQDPTPGDQSASVTTDVRAVADVRVAKATLTDPVVAGEAVGYRIDIVNDGPSDAPVVAVSDTLPAALTGVSWTCVGASGASCPASGSGAPAFDASLPVGGALAIRVDGMVLATATGALTNVASAVVQPPVSEPAPLDNEARVDDAVVVRSDVSLVLSAPLNPFDPAASGDLPLRVQVANAGPSMARDLEVLLDLSQPVRQTQPGCTRPTPSQVRCLISQLLPGDEQVLELAFDRLPSAPATLVIDGAVSTRSEDLVPVNDADSVSVNLVNGADLSVSIDNGTIWLSPDETFAYTVRVDNFGSQTVFGADVNINPDADLLDVSWTCSASGGAACTASGTGPIADLADVPSGGVLIYTLIARVNPDVDLTVPVSVLTEAAVSSTAPPVELNAVNNLDVDDDEVRLTMFEDGFEPIAGSTRVLLAPSSCVEAELSVSNARSLPSGRALEAVAVDRRRMLWLDVSHRDGGPWLRIAARDEQAVDASGWLRWPETAETLTLRVERGRVHLAVGADRLWQSAVTLPVQGARLGRDTRVRQASCSSTAGAR